MAAVIGIVAQEPPETTGPDEDDAPAGACAGCCRPSPVEPELPELPEFPEFPELAVALGDEDPPPDPEGCALADPLELTVWPWNDLAATSETAPDSATAAAIVQRLTRETSLSPASRAVTAGGGVRARPAKDGEADFIDPMIGSGGKRTLNAR